MMNCILKIYLEPWWRSASERKSKYMIFLIFCTVYLQFSNFLPRLWKACSLLFTALPSPFRTVVCAKNPHHPTREVVTQRAPAILDETTDTERVQSRVQHVWKGAQEVAVTALQCRQSGSRVPAHSQYTMLTSPFQNKQNIPKLSVH